MDLAIRSLWLALLSILALRPLLIAAYDCNIQPLSWKVQNATFKNGVAVNRGIKIQLPGDQIVGLRPSFFFNNTRLRNTVDCMYNNANDSQFVICEGASGSVFDPRDPGFQQQLTSVWASEVETVDAPPVGAVLVQGMGLAQFDDGTNLELPMEVWSNPSLGATSGTPNRSILAMGPKSSVLERLIDMGHIPSLVLGLFYGSRSVDLPTTGELTLGGYDAARMASPLLNYSIAAFPMNVSCPLRVRVSSVTLSNSNGVFEILNPGQVIPACIDTVQNAISFTDDMYDRWSSLTNYSPIIDGQPVDSQTYLAQNDHLMNTLTIGLDNGYNTTIPHYELVVPFRGSSFNDLGQYAVINSSRIQSAVSVGLTDIGIDFGMLLGGVFLSGTYLFVDYERNTFGLANANLTAQNSIIQPVCSLNTSRSTNSTSGPSTAGSAAPKTTTSGGNSSGGGGLSWEGGVGIAFGIIGAILAAMGVWYARRQYLLAQNKERRKSSLALIQTNPQLVNQIETQTTRETGTQAVREGKPQAEIEALILSENEITHQVGMNT